MKVVTITEPNVRFKDTRPQEDYTLRSKVHSIFVVADGVTLEGGTDGSYPESSGAAEAARLFCEASLRKAEKLFDNFKEEYLKDIFRAGNEAVGSYNRVQGRTKETIDYFTYDFFAATVAFALLKDNKLYWFSLCDSYVSVFNATGRKKFSSPEPWAAVREKMATLEEADPVERRKKLRRLYRNSADFVGYGVATGEQAAESYLNRGVLNLSQGGFFTLYTDGFENYFKIPEFISLFQNWPDNLEQEIRVFTALKVKNNPAVYGEERSLIAAAL